MQTIKIRCESAQTIPFQKLKPFQGELKSLSKENYEKLRGSIIEYGFTSPMNVWRESDDNWYTLDGHQRCRVLEKMGEEGFNIPEIPVSFIHAESIDEAKRILITHASQYGKVEKQGLYEFAIENGIEPDELFSIAHFPEINAEAFKTEFFIDHDTNAAKEEIEDDIPTVSDTRAKMGDIWQLGDHRVMCGDATDVAMVEELMNGEKAALCLTDPPYNVDYEGKTKDALKIENDKKEDSQFFDFLRDSFVNYFTVMHTGAPIYIFHADSEGYNFRGAMKEAGFKMAQCLIWVKNQMVMGRQDYHWKHEPILYGWKEGSAHSWHTDRKQTTVWEFDRPQRNAEHPTMKPIHLLEYPIGNSSSVGSLVIDFFGGSGSTLIACEKLNRKCYTMELDPRYVDVILARYEKYADKEAVLLNPEG